MWQVVLELTFVAWFKVFIWIKSHQQRQVQKSHLFIVPCFPEGSENYIISNLNRKEESSRRKKSGGREGHGGRLAEGGKKWRCMSYFLFLSLCFQLMWKSFSNYDVDWRAAAVPSPGSCPSPHRSPLTALWWIRNCHPGRLSLVYKSTIPHLSPQAL